MDLLSLLQDIITMVVVGNAVTGHKDESMTEDYVDILESILKMGDNN